VTTVTGQGKPGTVVDQHPKPGTKVEEEARVAVVLEQAGAPVMPAAGGIMTTPGNTSVTPVSTATTPAAPMGDFVSLPDLTGKTIEQATAALAAIGLGVGRTHAEIVDQPAGHIFKTSPTKGTQVAPGSPVELYLASDSHALVPEVKGKSLGEAEQLLRSAGFKIGTRHNVAEQGTPGQVIRTEPDAPAGAPRGTSIDIFVRQESDPNRCVSGFVWREAFPGDLVCVTPQIRAQAAMDNAQAASRYQPGGGPYGPQTCRQGLVWREANAHDRVCVSPATRAQAASDNAQAASRRTGG
jgi:beta-lactam-binding protein with PASTA domain